MHDNDAMGGSPAAGEVRIERRLPGPVERVWSYLTDSEKRGTWLAPGEMDLRVGGRVEHRFRHADLSHEKEPPERYAAARDGHVLHGTILRCDPPRLLSYTWGDEPTDSEVTFELFPLEDGDVRLVVTHRRLRSRDGMANVASGWHTHLGLLLDRLARDEPRGFWSTHGRLEPLYRERFRTASPAPVTRAVSTRDVDGQPAHVLRVSRFYATSQATLWACLTDPGRIPQWFLPITGELRPGGRFQLEGNAGGEVLECDAPRHLAVTWEMHGQPSWLTLTLAPGEDGTRLTLEHVAHVPAGMWQQYGPGAVGVGWDQAMLGLDRYLAGGAAVEPAAVAAWTASEGGVAFTRDSSNAWCAASIAAGTDPATAAAAAERTVAFYTGAVPAS